MVQMTVAVAGVVEAVVVVVVVDPVIQKVGLDAVAHHNVCCTKCWGLVAVAAADHVECCQILPPSSGRARGAETNYVQHLLQQV